FGHEFDWRNLRKDVGVLAVNVQETGEALIRPELLDQPFAPLEQTTRARRTQEEPAQPFRKVAADRQQVALSQLVDELRRHVVLTSDHVVRVLQDILVMDRENRSGPRLAKQVQEVHLAGPLGPIVRKVALLSAREHWRLDDLVDATALTQAAR